MRIAQVPPLMEAVPPARYGGTERVVSWLTEELVRQGHEVTLFGTADSVTGAELCVVCDRSLRTAPEPRDALAAHVVQLEMVARRDDFDVVHYHGDYLHLPVATRRATPFLTTMHGRMDLPDLARVLRSFPEAPLVSVSNAQRAPLRDVGWVATIHHGMPAGNLPLCAEEGRYFVFLGRICRDKGVPDAIEIARRTGVPLKIAAKIDKVDRDYFEDQVKPRIDGSLVEYVGEVDEAGKAELLGGALALLFPIDWPEPFGLVMIEAMACGTPTLATPRGSVPEVIEDGVSGFIVAGVDEAVRVAPRLAGFDRRRCRAAFEARFTAPRMAQKYLAAYRELAAGERSHETPREHGGGHPDRGPLLHPRHVDAGRGPGARPQTR